jgi:hypothetical protein
MFRLTKKFNQDISKWNVSGVHSMRNMFEESVFNQDISAWDVSNVTGFYDMFRKSKFDKDLNNWKVNKDALLYNMFDDCPIKQKNKLPKWYHEEKETVIL